MHFFGVDWKELTDSYYIIRTKKIKILRNLDSQFLFWIGLPTYNYEFLFKEAKHLDYSKSVQEIRGVARAGAVILENGFKNGIKAKDIHLVGFSMGCQMASFIAKG